jgi:AraC-like DNA-binding protein
MSFEWHDFDAPRDVDWGRSFHPDSVEICLNLSGTGLVSAGGEEIVFAPESAGFYRQGANPLQARRIKGEHHQFVTAEYSADFLRRHFSDRPQGLHPLVAAVLEGRKAESGIAQPHRLRSEQRQLVRSLRTPPVYSTAEQLWYESKALELAAMFFFEPPREKELFCDRQKQLAQERCERVIAILNAELENPPTLEDLGKKVGCSHFYLSRTFSKEMGMTIAQYLRKIRMEKAAALLKSGKYNVTQAALEVGYSSLSHFSQAFHEAFGCCPGLYGIAPDHQRRS